MNPSDIAALIQQYGLPLVILGGFGWLILTGRLVTGRELTKMTALFEREREDRIAAQKTSAEVASASANIAESVERVIDLYGERQTGVTARARR